MDFQERLHFVTHHTRAAMLRYATLETCILTTKMLCHIIPELLGVNVMPIGVGVIGCNLAARKTIEGSGFAEPTTHEGTDAGEVVLMCSHRGEDATIPGSPWWGGHLVLITDNRYLVDGSADQFNTPEVGLRTKPFAFDFGSSDAAYDWMMGDDMVCFALPDGALIGYEPHLEDFSYRPSMDWDETKPGDKLYDAVLERVRGLLYLYEGETLTPGMLPVLPQTLSRKYGASDKEIFDRELKAAKDLGYTNKELAEKIAREKERDAERAQKHPAGADPVLSTEDLARSMVEAGEATTAAAKKMEPKLLAALAKAGTRYYDQAESPLASNPPSSP